MYKKTLLLLLLSFAATQWSHAQILDSFLSSEQEFIKKATDSVLFIIRQDYVLRDHGTGQEYGRGGRDHFGRIYTLGVLSENKLWCEKTVRQPWVKDVNYNQYREVDSIMPLLSKTAIRRLTEKEFTEIDLLDSLHVPDSALSMLNIAALHLKKPLRGVSQMPTSFQKQGWMIAITSKENIYENEATGFKYHIYKAKTNPNPEKSLCYDGSTRCDRKPTWRNLF